MNETVDPQALNEASPAPRQLEPTPARPQRPPPRRRYRLGRIALIVAIAIVIIAVGLKLENIGVSTLEEKKPDRPAGPPPQSVTAADIVSGDMPIVINALGTVTPLATITLKSQVSGKLMSVGFTEGQLVKQGDFLAQIDDGPFKATLQQAQAQFAKDSSTYDQAVADFNRYQTLKQQDSIARQQVEDQQFVVAQDKAAVAVDQAQIDAAKLNIGYAHIVSPIAGRVGLRLVDPGNYVQPSDATGIVVITELDPISVVFSTPEDNLQRIAKRFYSGAKLAVAVFDRSNVKKLADGELSTFDNQVDTTTGTFKLRATFGNSNYALFPSQFVNVRLLVDTRTGATIAPNAAVQIGANGSYVYVINDDKTVSVRNITTGPSDDSRTVIESGLKVGEKVVIDGVDRLKDAAKVRVVAAPAAGATPAGAAPDDGQSRRKRPRGDKSPTPAASP